MANKFAKAKADRMALESKYTKLAISHKGSFRRISQGKISSISPAAYYYATGANASAEDLALNKECNKVLHSKSNNNKRAVVEKKIKNLFIEKDSLLATELPIIKIKEIFYKISYKEYSNNIKLDKYYEGYFCKSNKNMFVKISKHKFAELQNLFAQFEELSKYEHYKPNNAEKRLIKKENLIY